MTTVANAIIALLKGYGVDTVFGIPGVHTIELYRGIVDSGLRHVTPRTSKARGSWRMDMLARPASLASVS